MDLPASSRTCCVQHRSELAASVTSESNGLFGSRAVDTRMSSPVRRYVMAWLTWQRAESDRRDESEILNTRVMSMTYDVVIITKDSTSCDGAVMITALIRGRQWLLVAAGNARIAIRSGVMQLEMQDCPRLLHYSHDRHKSNLSLASARWPTCYRQVCSKV